MPRDPAVHCHFRRFQLLFIYFKRSCTGIAVCAVVCMGTDRNKIIIRLQIVCFQGQAVTFHPLILTQITGAVLADHRDSIPFSRIHFRPADSCSHMSGNPGFHRHFRCIQFHGIHLELGCGIGFEIAFGFGGNADGRCIICFQAAGCQSNGGCGCIHSPALQIRIVENRHIVALGMLHRLPADHLLQMPCQRCNFRNYCRFQILCNRHGNCLIGIGCPGTVDQCHTFQIDSSVFRFVNKADIGFGLDGVSAVRIAFFVTGGVLFHHIEHGSILICYSILQQFVVPDILCCNSRT